MTAISTVLIGRNKLFREGLKSLFRGSQFDVVSEASDVSDVRALIGDDVPSLCLLDLSANSGHAVDDLAHLRRMLPDAKIVILTDALSTQTLIACLAAGAHGYLIKDISVDALLQSLSQTLAMHGGAA